MALAETDGTSEGFDAEPFQIMTEWRESQGDAPTTEEGASDGSE